MAEHRWTRRHGIDAGGFGVDGLYEFHGCLAQKFEENAGTAFAAKTKCVWGS